MKIKTIKSLVVLCFASFINYAEAETITVQGVLRTKSGSLYNYTAPDPSGVTVRFRHISDSTPAGGTIYDAISDYPIVIQNGAFSVSLEAEDAVSAMAADSDGWYVEISGILNSSQTASATYRIPLSKVPQAMIAEVARALPDGGLTNDMIADETITGSKLATGSITGAAIGSGEITSTNLADDSVLLSKIAQDGATDGQVLTWDDDSSSWVPSTVSAGDGGTVTSVATGTGLTGGPITTSGTISLADNGVSSSKIANGAIVDEDVNASAAIGWSKISKTGSSLADMATRSAGDLNSGTLGSARLPVATNTAIGAMRATTGKITLDGDGVITNITADTAALATSSTNFSGSLTGDVSGGQSTTVVDEVGGKTAADIASAVDDVGAATNANTASTIVKRDASGNFSAGTITTTTALNSPSLLTDSGSAAAPSFSFNSDTDTGMYSSGANTLNFSIAGTNRVSIDSIGRFGLGITPGAPLHISGTAFTGGNSMGQVVIHDTSGTGLNASHMIAFNDSAGTRQAAIYKEGGSGSLNWVNDQNAPIKFVTNGSDRLVVTGSGNIGVGTIDPQSKIHVNSGDVAITGNQKLKFLDSSHNEYGYITSGGAYNMIIGVGGSDRVTIDNSAVMSLGGITAGINLYSETDSTGLALGVRKTSFPTSSYVYSAQGSGSFPFNGWGDLLLGAASTKDVVVGRTSQLVVKDGGNVGIGNTDPSEKLEISGNAKITNGVMTVISSDNGSAGSLYLQPNNQSQFSQVGWGGMYSSYSLTLSSGAGQNVILTPGVNVEVASGALVIGSSSVTSGYKFDSIGDGRFQGSLCVISGAGACSSTNDGTIYASNTTVEAADLAENMPVEDKSIQAGDVVVVENSLKSNRSIFAKSRYSNQSNVVGVVSTKPGVSLGSATLNSRPLALAGRVPVNVTLEGGSIKVGDYLVSSSTPGRAMKADSNSNGAIIGIALSNYDGSFVQNNDEEDGIAHPEGDQVMLLVQTSNSTSSHIESRFEQQEKELTQLRAELADIKTFVKNQKK